MVRCVLLDRPGSVEYLDVEDREEAARRYVEGRVARHEGPKVDLVFHVFADGTLYRATVHCADCRAELVEIDLDAARREFIA